MSGDQEAGGRGGGEGDLTLQPGTAEFDRAIFSCVSRSGLSGTLDDYVQEDKLGEGAYGVVLKGRHKRTNAEVALKMIKVDEKIMTERGQGFPLSSLREIKALKSLTKEDSDNVVKVHEIVAQLSEDGHLVFYMVMDYLRHDLCGLLHFEAGRMGSPQVKGILQQILRGLNFLHLNNILHRDMKPENVLLSTDGCLKLADFGLARTQPKQSGAMTPGMVSLYWRAPELLLGATRYGPGVDVWAVGVMFAELLQRREGSVFVPQVRPDEKDMKVLEASVLRKIVEALGTPDPKDAAGESFYEGFGDLNTSEAKLLRGWPRFTRSIEGRMAAFAQHPHSGALDLLSRMLRYECSRATAVEALDHAYLTSAEPAPSTPAELARHFRLAGRPPMLAAEAKKRIRMANAAAQPGAAAAGAAGEAKDGSIGSRKLKSRVLKARGRGAPGRGRGAGRGAAAGGRGKRRGSSVWEPKEVDWLAIGWGPGGAMGVGRGGGAAPRRAPMVVRKRPKADAEGSSAGGAAPEGLAGGEDWLDAL